MRSKRSEFGFRFTFLGRLGCFRCSLVTMLFGVMMKRRGGRRNLFFSFAGVPFAFVRPLAGARRVAEDAIVAECGTIVIC